MSSFKREMSDDEISKLDIIRENIINNISNAIDFNIYREIHSLVQSDLYDQIRICIVLKVRLKIDDYDSNFFDDYNSNAEVATP